MNELLRLLTLEDIEDKKCHEMASLIGIDAFVELVNQYGGSNPYIPEVDRLVIPIRDVLIKREFDGTNYFHLAKKWGLSERYIRDITKEVAQEIRVQPINGQMKFF